MLANARHRFDIFGGAALHQAKNARQFLEPIGKAVGKFELQNDLRAEDTDRVFQLRIEQRHRFRFAFHRPVQGDPDRVVSRADPGFAQVIDVRLGPGSHLMHQLAEILQNDQLSRIPRDQMGRLGQMPGQQPVHRLSAHPAALLGDDIVHASFDLEKNRRLLPVVIKPQPQLEPVLVPVDRLLTQNQVIGVQIKTVHRVGEIRQGGAIFINLQVAAHEVPHRQRNFFLDDILQFKPLLLHFVFSHTKIIHRASVPSRGRGIVTQP